MQTTAIPTYAYANIIYILSQLCDIAENQMLSNVNSPLSIFLLFPFVRGKVLPATSSPPHLIVFSTLLCLLSSSSSLPPLQPSSQNISLRSIIMIFTFKYKHTNIFICKSRLDCASAKWAENQTNINDGNSFRIKLWGMSPYRLGYIFRSLV